MPHGRLVPEDPSIRVRNRLTSRAAGKNGSPDGMSTSRVVANQSIRAEKQPLTEMKIQKQAYTAEIKELAVKRVKDGQRVSEVSFDGVDRLLPGDAG